MSCDFKNKPIKKISYITFKEVIKESVVIRIDNKGRKKSLNFFLGASLSNRKSKPPLPPIIIITKQTLLGRT